MVKRRTANENNQGKVITDEENNGLERDGSSSLTRMLGVLDLYTVDNPMWSTTDILDAIETSRSTGYRYIKALTSAGLLSPVGNGYYVLGPRIIELDLQIRRTDPLLQASDGILEQLADETGYSALLCTLFQNTVLCVRECLVEPSPSSLIDRGQRRPLFRGTMSKVILANLSIHQLKNIFSRRQAEISAAHLGDTWDDFRNAMASIRADGFAQSAGEFTPELCGVSAPVFNAEDAVIGSVGVAFDIRRMTSANIERIIPYVKRAGRTISQRMESTDIGPVLRPRAVG